MLELSNVDLLELILTRARRILLDARSRRIWPARDEKILAAWNGLMLRGVATAARVFDRKDFAKTAMRNAEFLAREMVRNGRVMRSHKEGVTRINGFLEDHASVALGFLAALIAFEIGLAFFAAYLATGHAY